MIGNQAGSGSAFPDFSLIILPQMLNILTSWATLSSQNIANTFPPLCLAQGDTSSQHPHPSQSHPVNLVLRSHSSYLCPPSSQQLGVISNYCKSPKTWREEGREGRIEENFLYRFLKWGKLQGRIYLLTCRFPLGEQRLLEGECYVLPIFISLTECGAVSDIYLMLIIHKCLSTLNSNKYLR